MASVNLIETLGVGVADLLRASVESSVEVKYVLKQTTMGMNLATVVINDDGDNTWMATVHLFDRRVILTVGRSLTESIVSEHLVDIMVAESLSRISKEVGFFFKFDKERDDRRTTYFVHG